MRNTLIILVLISCMAAAESKPTIPDIQNLEAPTKEEAGILATIANVYAKVRTAVRYTYDEIQYWKAMYRSYNEISSWLQKNKSRVLNISDDTYNLFAQPADVFTTLDRMTKIFDQIDYVATYETQNFDHILASAENTWDKIATDKFTYNGMTITVVPGLLIPNTNQTLNYIEGTFFDAKDSAGLTASAEDKALVDQSNRVKDSLAKNIDTNWQEERLRRAAALVSASAMGNSEMYTAWAVKTSQAVADKDDKIKGISGVNPTEMSAAWYGLENCNANNKQILHSIEEAKVLNALLGFELYHYSNPKGQVVNQQGIFNEINTGVLVTRYKNQSK